VAQATGTDQRNGTGFHAYLADTVGEGRFTGIWGFCKSGELFVTEDVIIIRVAIIIPKIVELTVGDTGPGGFVVAQLLFLRGRGPGAAGEAVKEVERKLVRASLGCGMRWLGHPRRRSSNELLSLCSVAA